MKFPERRPMFFPYLLADFPNPKGFGEILERVQSHADAIEIGIPFSDPVADGPIIQQAVTEVLNRGFRMESLFRRLQQTPRKAPIALMTYANPVWAYGRDDFLKACAQCNVNAMIVPDVPFEESSEWRSAAQQHGIDWISFVSLQTRARRLKQIASEAKGFIYLLSLTGITGSNISASSIIEKRAAEIRQHTDVPIALGFGIKSAEDARKFGSVVDAFIVGSRIVELARQSADSVEEFCRTFRKELAL